MDVNPYQPPRIENATPRLDRNSLAGLIRELLDTSPDLATIGEKVECYGSSKDPTCRLVADLVVDYCDEELSGPQPLTKSEWDCLQRFLLVLESKCDLQEKSERSWCWTQVVAAVCLAVFFCAVAWLGIGNQLLAVTIPLGLISMLIAKHARERGVPERPYAQIIFPFATFSDLSRCYHGSEFKKEKYPQHLRGLEMQDESSGELMFAVAMLVGFVMWLMLSPLVLLFQVLPEVDTSVVAVPENSNARLASAC
ncbi:MAG: hypothetical protein Aurels2KO_42180 [Aureliella sp.]